MTAPDILLREEIGAVTRLTLNRPERMNALSGQLARALDLALTDSLAPDSPTRALLITGAGRGFCAGADLTERLEVPEGGTVLETWYHPMIRRLRTCPLPVVVAVNGIAAGAGMSLALLGDIVTCAESASFLQAFVKAGLVPDCGASWLLPRRIGEARAREMALLAERLPAAQALDWGLVNRVFPDESLQSESLALATRLAEGPVNAQSRTRALFEASPCNDFEAQIPFEAKMQSQCSGAPESREGRAAFAEKRTPDFINIPLASREHTT